MLFTLPSSNKSIDKGVDSIDTGTRPTRELPPSCMVSMRGGVEVWEERKEQTIYYTAGNGAAGRLASAAEDGHGFRDMLSL
jgi:hypothetical protein